MKAYVIIGEMIDDHLLQIRMDLWIRYSLKSSWRIYSTQFLQKVWLL